jgi:hypothetical protein
VSETVITVASAILIVIAFAFWTAAVVVWIVGRRRKGKHTRTTQGH